MKLFGHFYFKQTVNGNLHGEYAHNKMNDVCAESGTVVTRGHAPFEGEFWSAWLDDANSRMANLFIKATKELNHLRFTLEWRLDDKEIYHGEGTLCGDILIGHYWML